MSTDFRALCAELHTAVQLYTGQNPAAAETPANELVARLMAALAATAAALAQPEPERLPPRVGHILRLAEIIREVDGNHDKGAAALAEAILSHPGSRWSPTIEPEGVGDEDIPQWSEGVCGDGAAILRDGVMMPIEEVVASLNRAEILTRWGRPTTEPVPVAERLPEPEDCDAEGRCWWLTLAVADGGRGGYSTFWELTTFKAAMRCASHWLPHHALPLPTPAP
jgi:hypothetical protein